MNFMPRNGVLAVPAWCPPQENQQHWLYHESNALRGSSLLTIPAVSWDMSGPVKVSFSSRQTPNFSFSGQLGRKSDQQQGSQSSGQVTAGEQKPDGAGVSVPPSPATFPLGTPKATTTSCCPDVPPQQCLVEASGLNQAHASPALLTLALSHPSLRSNSIGPTGAKALADALKKNQTLLSLK